MDGMDSCNLTQFVLQLQQSEHISHHLPTFTYHDNTIPVSLSVCLCAASNKPAGQLPHLQPACVDVCVTKCH